MDVLRKIGTQQRNPHGYHTQYTISNPGARSIISMVEQNGKKTVWGRNVAKQPYYETEQELFIDWYCIYAVQGQSKIMHLAIHEI